MFKLFLDDEYEIIEGDLLYKISKFLFIISLVVILFSCKSTIVVTFENKEYIDFYQNKKFTSNSNYDDKYLISHITTVNNASIVFHIYS